MIRRLFNLCLNYIRAGLSRRWVRFTLVGGVATVSYFVLGLLFVDFFKLPLLFGNALAYTLSFVISYLGQCLWTFEAGHNHLAMLPKFAITQLVGLGINSCIIGLCVRLGLVYMLAMLVAILITPVFVFFICKYWVFRKPG